MATPVSSSCSDAATTADSSIEDGSPPGDGTSRGSLCQGHRDVAVLSGPARIERHPDRTTSSSSRAAIDGQARFDDDGRVLAVPTRLEGDAQATDDPGAVQEAVVPPVLRPVVALLALEVLGGQLLPGEVVVPRQRRIGAVPAVRALQLGHEPAHAGSGATAQRTLPQQRLPEEREQLGDGDARVVTRPVCPARERRRATRADRSRASCRQRSSLRSMNLPPRSPGRCLAATRSRTASVRGAGRQRNGPAPHARRPCLRHHGQDGQRWQDRGGPRTAPPVNGRPVRVACQLRDRPRAEGGASMLRRLVSAVTVAALLATLAASAAFAGEITGNGKSLHVEGGGKWGTGLQRSVVLTRSPARTDLQYETGGSRAFQGTPSRGVRSPRPVATRCRPRCIRVARATRTTGRPRRADPHPEPP